MDFVMPVRVSNRKHFTTAQKHAILDEYVKCLACGSKAVFIRSAGIRGKASALLEAMAKSAAATDPKVEEPEPGRPEWLTPKPGKTSH